MENPCRTLDWLSPALREVAFWLWAFLAYNIVACVALALVVGFRHRIAPDELQEAKFIRDA